MNGRLLAWLRLRLGPRLILLISPKEVSLGILRGLCDDSLGHADFAAGVSMGLVFSLIPDWWRTAHDLASQDRGVVFQLWEHRFLSLSAC